MTRESVAKAVQLACVWVRQSTLLGLEIWRSGYVDFHGGVWHPAIPSLGTWKDERWRVQCGGGIAGNGGKWWATRIIEEPGTTNAIGPYTSQKALAKALRAWKKWRLP